MTGEKNEGRWGKVAGTKQRGRKDKQGNRHLASAQMKFTELLTVHSYSGMWPTYEVQAVDSHGILLFRHIYPTHPSIMVACLVSALLTLLLTRLLPESLAVTAAAVHTAFQKSQLLPGIHLWALSVFEFHKKTVVLQRNATNWFHTREKCV